MGVKILALSLALFIQFNSLYKEFEHRTNAMFKELNGKQIGGHIDVYLLTNNLHIYLTSRPSLYFVWFKIVTSTSTHNSL